MNVIGHDIEGMPIALARRRGLLTTGLQVGNAIGVAVIGVIFYAAVR